jgi:hypothetical protein
MEQFVPVKRSKDGQPVRYLVVDDSVFARKNLARMIETFGGQLCGEAGDGMTAITEYDRTNPDIVLMDITMPQMENRAETSRRACGHGVIGRVSGKHCGGPAAWRAPFRAEASQARGSVRSHQVRNGR